MINNRFLQSVLTAVLAVALGISVVHQCKRVIDRNKNASCELASDTLIVHDTITFPILKDSQVIRYKTVMVPIYRDADTLKPETCVVKKDTVFISLPITQKVYQDSSYYAVVSGYDASLDTIVTYQKQVTNTVYKTTEKSNRLGIGVGVGYDPLNNKPALMIGATYNLFNF